MVQVVSKEETGLLVVLSQFASVIQPLSVNGTTADSMAGKSMWAPVAGFSIRICPLSMVVRLKPGGTKCTFVASRYPNGVRTLFETEAVFCAISGVDRESRKIPTGRRFPTVFGNIELGFYQPENYWKR